MKNYRSLLGFTALATLAIGVNLAVLKKDFFSATVLLVLAAALLTGALWAAWVILARVRDARPEGAASLYGLNFGVNAIVFLGICMVLYAFAAHWNRSWDLTQEGRRQLSEQTVRVLESMSEDVSVLCFFLKIDDERVATARRKTESFLDQCRRHSARLKIEMLDPQIDRVRLEGLQLTHHSKEGTVVIQCGTRQRVITLSGPNPRLDERSFTNGLINVLRNSQPKVAFLTGHGELDMLDNDQGQGGGRMKAALEAESYSVDRIGMKLSGPEIPADVNVLVIAGLGLRGPQGDLMPQEIQAIQAFLDRGGRLLLFIDPWIRASGTENQVEQLRPWLEQRYGIIVDDDILISPESQANVTLTPDPGPFDDQEKIAVFTGCYNREHRITQGFEPDMLLRVVRSIRLAEKLPEGVTGSALLRTTPDFWAEKDIALLKQTGKASRTPDTEPNGPLTLAAAVTAKIEKAGEDGRPRDARIVVVGDSDFVANGPIVEAPGHLNFLLNTLAWLTEREDLIAIRPPAKDEKPIILSDNQERFIVWICVLGTLQVVVAAGIGAHILRRRHQ